MKIFIVCYVLLIIWLAFEMWRAPVLLEKSDGGFKTIRPERKLSDLWKKKKK